MRPNLSIMCEPLSNSNVCKQCASLVYEQYELSTWSVCVYCTMGTDHQYPSNTAVLAACNVCIAYTITTSTTNVWILLVMWATAKSIVGWCTRMLCHIIMVNPNYKAESLKRHLFCDWHGPIGGHANAPDTLHAKMTGASCQRANHREKYSWAGDRIEAFERIQVDSGRLHNCVNLRKCVYMQMRYVANCAAWGLFPCAILARWLCKMSKSTRQIRRTKITGRLTWPNMLW